MKMRKLFAGLAAAATLLSGLALGATTANADDTGVVLGSTQNSDDIVNFTFTASDPDQWKNREIKYYKIADYVKYTDGQSTHYGVKTAAGANKTAIKEALEAAVKGTNLTVPNDNTTDLMAWALQNNALDNEGKPWTGSTRLFADTLAQNATVKQNLKTVSWPDYGNGTPQEGQKDRWTNLLYAGVYLFVDTTVSNGNSGDGTGGQANNGNVSNGTEQKTGNINDTTGGKVVTQSAPIVLASGVVKDGEIENPYGPAADADGVQRNTVEFKNHVTPVSKVFDDKDGTVSTGQTVKYTLTSELPSVTTGFTNYKFTLTDTPGKGQTVDLSNGLVVKVGGSELQQGTGNDQYELKFNNLTTEEENAKKFDGNAAKQFVIDLSKYVQNKSYDAKANLKVTVTYQATINEQAKANHEVPNSVEVNDNNSKATDKTSLTLGKFSFTKTDAQGNALQGAQFTITAAENGAVIPSDADKVATSNEQGVVTFDGLADGVYEVTETKVPTDFAQSFAAKFKVTIENGKATNFDGTDIYGLAPDVANPSENAESYKVKNVRNITELPKTGAAGIALFGVIALLLAGAGTAVYMQSRRTRHALHA